ncbi:hypothetical protein [Vallitalea okinawensis]|uniref:hypothetical protein n=1 Tax=Vallitalea okinawensis TaxID=2078660 RepID=UPI000CFC92EB|nr:hypothetical protein [Vallitalea okinawensis]
MNIDQIVAMVTKEVLKRIEDTADIQANSSTKVFIADTKKASYKELEELLTLGGFITLYMDENKEMDWKDINYVIVPTLTPNLLSKVALGLVEEQITEVLQEAFLCGKHVVVLEEGASYRKYKTIASSSYYNMLAGYEEQWTQFGASFIREEELIAFLKGLPTCVNVIDKRVVTEADLNRLYEKGHHEIRISKRSLISPLASDYVRMHNINVIRV